MKITVGASTGDKQARPALMVKSRRRSLFQVVFLEKQGNGEFFGKDRTMQRKAPVKKIFSSGRKTICKEVTHFYLFSTFQASPLCRPGHWGSELYCTFVCHILDVI